MSSITKINNLRTERNSLAQRLLPLTKTISAKNTDLQKLRALQASAEADLDAAMQNAALIAGQHLTGDATTEQVAAAERQRQAALERHRGALNDAAVIRALDNEVKGLNAAVAPLANRSAAIIGEEKVATEAYVRDLGEQAGAAYAEATRNLAEKFADVVAVNQVLARMDHVQPDLLTGAFENLMVPGFNLSTASSPSGLLMDTERARKLFPAAFVALKDRLSEDGVVIRGVS